MPSTDFDPASTLAAFWASVRETKTSLMSASLVSSRILTLVCLAIPACVFLVLNDAFLHGPTSYDEAWFVWSGWCFNKGLRPYLDFLEFRPPFIFLTHALALKLHGFDGFRYRYFFCYFPLSALLAVHGSLLSRGVDKILSITFMVGFIYLFVSPAFHDIALSDSESIGLSYYLFGLAFLLARTRFRFAFDMLGGAFLLACAQSKEPFIPAVFATWIACFFTRRPLTTRRKDIVLYLKGTVGGAMVVILALCILMVPTGSMRMYFLTVKSYFTGFRDPAKSYCVLLGRFHPTTRWNDLVVQWNQARREFLNPSNLSYLFPFTAATFALTLRRNFWLFVFAFFAVIGGLIAVTASNCQWMHYYNMTMTGLFLFWAVGLDSLSTFLRKSSSVLRPFVQVTVAGIVLMHIYPRFEAQYEVFGKRTFGTPYVEPVPGIFRVVAEHTTPEDRIFTTGMPTLYIQTDRISAVRESVFVDEMVGFYEGNTDEELFSPIYAQLKKNMPKVVVLDPESGYRKLRHNRALFEPFLTSEKYQRLSDYIYLRPN